MTAGVGVVGAGVVGAGAVAVGAGAGGAGGSFQVFFIPFEGVDYILDDLGLSTVAVEVFFFFLIGEEACR